MEAKVKTPKKTKWKVVTYEMPIKGKLAKQVREHQEREQAENNLNRSYLREVAAFLDGYKLAKGLEPQTIPFTNAHINAVRKAISKL